MAFEVTLSKDPARILGEAGTFMASKPVLHNVILTLLHERVAAPEPGRYWMARDGREVVGVAFQSPLDFAANLTPMKPQVIAAIVDAIVDTNVVLPGVIGEASTAARFAGQWTEGHGSAAFPVEGQRIYELSEMPEPIAVGGRLRRASLDDRDLVRSWMRSFYADVGETVLDPEPIVDQRLAAGRFWLWEDGDPVAMAANSEPIEGVCRIQAVYTPPERRMHGYAGACVGEVSREIHDSGYRCILYTDLGNPTSNSVYRRIGFRGIAEALRYRFG